MADFVPFFFQCVNGFGFFHDGDHALFIFDVVDDGFDGFMFYPPYSFSSSSTKVELTSLEVICLAMK